MNLSNESKSSLSVSNEAKSAEGTFAEHTETFGETGPGGATLGAPGIPVRRESKNSLTISNESKT